MKKILIALGVSLASFVCGIVGIYLLLPHVVGPTPEELAADSLKQLEAHAKAPTTERTRPPADTLAGPVALPVRDAKPVVPSAAVDSMTRMHRENQRLRAENMALRKQLDQAKVKTSGVPTSRESVKDLTAQLTRLEDKELKQILAQLDNTSLEMLYQQAEGRSRVKLIKAMPPDRAARFVSRMTGGRTPDNTPAQPTGTR